MKILVVDDHVPFRCGLRLFLTGIRPDIAVFEAGTLRDAHALSQAHPDFSLCLLDLVLAGKRSIDAIASLKAKAPAIAVVMVSAVHDLATIRTCLDAGAMSFVPKRMSPEALTKALRRVLEGEVFLPADVVKIHGDSAGTGPSYRHAMDGVPVKHPT